MMDDSTVAILGAGITGLSAAYLLKKEGVDVTVYEKKDQAGGVIQSYRGDSWLVEKGPNTMLVRDSRIWNFLDELQLTDRIIKPDPEAEKRYVVRDKKTVAMPMSFGGFLKTNLFSIPAKLRLLKEPFISVAAKGDESIAGFIRRRLGPEILDYAVNPFVSGIYGGDPKQLSIKQTFSSLFEMEQRYGTLTKGFLKQKKDPEPAERTLISFDEGVQFLPQTIGRKLTRSLHLNTEVQHVSPAGNGWKLQLKSPEKKIARTHRVLISTLPTYQLASVWREDQSKQSIRKLAKINYAPMSVLALGFQRSQVRHPLNGFGILVPEKEPFSLLGCLFSSTLFKNRAPENHALLTCFAGGARNPELAAQSTRSLIQKIMPQLQNLLGVKGKPVFRHHTFWPKAIPQYTVGYEHYLREMTRIESSNSGLFLAGNYRGGISIPDCILNGFETAKKVKDLLNSKQEN